MSDPIEFYRLKGYERDLWFTDVSPVVLSEWALENNVNFKIQYNLSDRVGFMIEEKDKVMFELFWGANERRADITDSLYGSKSYYEDDY